MTLMSRSLVDLTSLYPALRAVSLAIPATCLLWSIGMSAALAQQAVQVREQDGLLSVQASNATAIELAEVLSNQLGISVVVTGDSEARVNIDIIDEPLDKALAKLSPNHMLVRKSKQSDSEIIEVVLMMGEGSSSGNSGGGEDQFLPSGSPADDVDIAVEESVDGTALRDPNRSSVVRNAADAASSDSAGLPTENSGESPPPDSFDPITGMPIDPVTGLPQE